MSGGNKHLKLIQTIGDGNAFGNSDGLKKSQEYLMHIYIIENYFFQIM